jgi:hypothetical protein
MSSLYFGVLTLRLQAGPLDGRADLLCIFPCITISMYLYWLMRSRSRDGIGTSGWNLNAGARYCALYGSSGKTPLTIMKYQAPWHTISHTRKLSKFPYEATSCPESLNFQHSGFGRGSPSGEATTNFQGLAILHSSKKVMLDNYTLGLGVVCRIYGAQTCR